MIDALLYAVRDAIRNAGFGYGIPQCDIMVDGNPPPSFADVFVAVHNGATKSTADNYLDERFSFLVTLTMRVSLPLDRVGSHHLAINQVRRQTPGPGKMGFNARVEQLRAFLHMNWGIMQDANTNLVAWEPSINPVYGFSEPARHKGATVHALVSNDELTALQSELTFADCRRFQAIATYV
jgi:hypothetical protein